MELFLRPFIDILRPDIDILRPDIDILRPDIDILSPDIDILRPDTDILRPDIDIFSIKHDLARSCFQLWPKIGDEGDKISRKKTGKALAETVFSRNSKYQASKYQYVASKY